MCGIAGMVGRPAAVAVPRVREALRRLAHRGPDGEGLFEAADAVLGSRRLAIIDLTDGDQPIFNEDRSVAVVCNGELYNYVEGFRDLEARGHVLQSRSDVNLIPHYYEELGARAFTRCRGMFAAALWDTRAHRLVLARDRVGKKPLFYATIDAGALAFASELPALLAMLERTPPHASSAIADYLQLGFIPHPQTIYQGVWCLPPGGTLEFEPGGEPRVTSYWEPTTPPPFSGSRRDAVARLDAHLREAVALRMRSDVPVGLFLSGGIDSGLVASYAREAGARDLCCFTVRVADSDLDESAAARATAAHLDLPVTEIPLDLAPREAIERVPLAYGQPFGDSSAIPSFYVAGEAARHRKVVLNGDGGDEILAGYRRYWMARAARWMGPLTAAARWPMKQIGSRLGTRVDRRSPWGFAGRMLRGLGTTGAARYLIWNVDLMTDENVATLFPDLPATGFANRLAQNRGQVVSADSLTACQRADYRLVLPDDLLVKMDIATMANSLEARSPLLDIPLAEFAWSLPESYRIRARETKPLLRALARARLPDAVAAAPKRGFEVPVARWLAHDLADVVGDLLLAPDGRVAAMGDREAVTRFVTAGAEFPGNHAQAVWALLMLEIFLRAPAPTSGGDD